MHKRILIATDGSDPSINAVLEGLDIAREHHASVIGAYVIDESTFNNMDINNREFRRRMRLQKEMGEKALKTLEDLAEPFDVPVEKVLRRGEPVKELLNLSKETRADLIVMGTHGRRGLKKLLHPSVAERFVKDSPCPVLVAH